MAHVIGIKERDAFEVELQKEVALRLNATIVNAIEMRTGAYSKSQHEAILRNLLERFTRDKFPLLAHFTGLRELPMDDDSRAQRLMAFEEIVHHYLPDVLLEELPMGGNEQPAGVHTEKLHVI